MTSLKLPLAGAAKKAAMKSWKRSRFIASSYPCSPSHQVINNLNSMQSEIVPTYLYTELTKNSNAEAQRHGDAKEKVFFHSLRLCASALN